MILYPYTAERRDVLGNTSPEAREIFQGPRGAKSPPEGNLSAEGDVFPNTSLLSAVYRYNTGVAKFCPTKKPTMAPGW